MPKRRTRGRPAGEPVHPVDVHVGQQLRSRRLLLGMSQKALADAVGLTFQQVQKYERAANRISVSRLFDFCKVLDVEFDYFIDGFTGRGRARPEIARQGMADADAQAAFEPEDDIMSRRETMTLVRAYYSIEDEGVRKQLLQMIRTMAKADGAKNGYVERRGRPRKTEK